MKKQVLFSLILACIAMTANATIWRVNNNPGISLGTNGRTNLYDALTAAVDGDIIYLEPSATSYASATINKAVKIIGNGAFLNDLPNPGIPSYQVNTNPSSISGDLSIQNSNVSVYGLTVSGNLTITCNSFGCNIAIITVQRCRIGGSVQLAPSISATLPNTNYSILENWIEGGIAHTNTAIVTDWKIKNNIILNGGVSIQLNDVVVIENNVLCSTTNVLTLANCNNVAVINNILNARGSGTLLSGSANASFANNIASTVTTGEVLPSGNGNQSSVDLLTVFGSFYPTGPFAFNPIPSSVELRLGSPALNAGLFGSGDDIGAFNNGTNRPTFVLGLIPPFPTIYALTAPGIVTTPTMTVTISTKSNN